MSSSGFSSILPQCYVSRSAGAEAWGVGRAGILVFEGDVIAVRKGHVGFAEGRLEGCRRRRAGDPARAGAGTAIIARARDFANAAMAASGCRGLTRRVQPEILRTCERCAPAPRNLPRASRPAPAD